MTFLPLTAFAGDDTSGPVQYSLDLGQPFRKHELTQKDRDWAAALVRKFAYTGKVVHFVRTTLPLLVDGTPVEGSVYQAVEFPDRFYVVTGDAMLRIGAQRPISPGCGGFSVHAPPSRAFIVCLNCRVLSAGLHSPKNVSHSSTSPLVARLRRHGGNL